MDLTINDCDLLKQLVKDNTKQASGINDPTDSIYFLYNHFLLSNDIYLFNIMMSRQKLLDKVIEQKLPGNFVEVGIMKTTFSNQIMKTLLINGVNKQLYLFDFFQDDVNMTSNNELNKITEIFERTNYKRLSTEQVLQNAKKINFNELYCIKGNVEKTIPNFLKENNSHFCFVYIDVDVVNPTLISLENLWERVVKNGIIVIDDYNSVKWGPFNVIDKFLKDKNVIITNLSNSLIEGLCIQKI